MWVILQFWVSLSFINSMNVSDHRQWAIFFHVELSEKADVAAAYICSFVRWQILVTLGSCRSFHGERIARAF